jgi:hypothetical protein
MVVATDSATAGEKVNTNKPGITDGVQVLTESGSLIVGSVTETTGTFSFDETAGGEQTVVTVAITSRALVGGIWLDMVNVTQNTTIRAYHQIDGTNYRVFYGNAWVLADPDGVLIDGFIARANIRITLQCGGGGAGSVNVPYAIE